MIVSKSSHHRRILSVLCFALLVVDPSGLAAAQDEPAGSRNWWLPSADGFKERGKMSELANKTKVYVTTSFTDSGSPSEPSPNRNRDVHRRVMDAFAMHKELQIVMVPSLAEFAVVVRTASTTESGERPPNFSFALDSSTAVAVEVMVIVPGSKRSDGTMRSRIVWESSSSNAQVEAHAAAGFTVDGFLLELSKLKNSLKVKTK